MRRTRITLGLVLTAAVLAVVARAAGHERRTGFRLPDASAACRLHGDTLVCRSLRVRAGVAISKLGPPRRAMEPIWWDASTRVLSTWRHNGVRCTVHGGQIVCVNGSLNSVSAGPTGISVAL
jgi:hypothetical protein